MKIRSLDLKQRCFQNVPLHLRKNRTRKAELLSLRIKVHSIQKVKISLGIENLAASSFFGLDTNDITSAFAGFLSNEPVDRISAAEELGEKHSPTGVDLFILECALLSESIRSLVGHPGVVGAIVGAMAQIAMKVSPHEMGKFVQAVDSGKGVALKDTCFYLDFSPDNRIGLVSISNGKFRPTWLFASHELSESTKHNAGVALAKILLKGGQYLPGRDQARFIKMLICSPVRYVRLCGSEVAAETYQREWRKHIQETSLIARLKNENVEEIRENISYAIARATPEQLFKEHIVDNKKFHPVAGILDDPSVPVKSNLVMGVTNLLLTENWDGSYYDDFDEVYVLSHNERMVCFKIIFEVMERYCYRDNLSDCEKELLKNSFTAITALVRGTVRGTTISSVDDDTIPDCLLNHPEWNSELVKLDLVKLLKNIVKASVPLQDFQQLRCPAIFVAYFSLVAMQTKLEDYIAYCFKLKKDLSQLKEQDVNLIPRYRDAVRVIDHAIGFYLSKNTSEHIRWGTYNEFSSKVNDLLEILEGSQEPSCQRAVINLFDSLNTRGVYLTDRGNISLDNAMNEANVIRLRRILKTQVHSQPATNELFLSPQGLSLPEKALMLCRTYKSDKIPFKSFKDYYGMSDLKQSLLRLGVKVVTLHKASKPLLLSGEPRTGKSMFAGVLANELALPLISVISSEVKDQKQQLEEIKRIGCCVVLIDEVERIALPSETNPAILSFLQELQKLPVITIGTTNSPATESIQGMDINDDGTSSEIDKVLIERIHPECLKYMQPCYLFHEKSVGVQFTQDYLSNLLDDGIDIKLVSNFAKGLIPKDIMEATDEALSSTDKVPQESKIISKLWNLQLGRVRIIDLARFVDETLTNLEFEGKLKTNGHIDRSKLAFVFEDMQDEKIEEILRGATGAVDQATLLRLLAKYSEIDPAVIQTLENI